MIALIGKEFMARPPHQFFEAGMALHRRQISASFTLASGCEATLARDPGTPGRLDRFW
jgi:hypothetical protein